MTGQKNIIRLVINVQRHGQEKIVAKSKQFVLRALEKVANFFRNFLRLIRKDG